MARIVAASFEGMDQDDVDVDQPTLTETFEKIIGELNYTYDHVTAENSPAVIHNHSGGANGAPILVPMAASIRPMTDDGTQLIHEWIGRSKSINSPLAIVSMYLIRVPYSSKRRIWLENPNGERSLPGFKNVLPFYAFAVPIGDIADLGDYAAFQDFVHTADEDLSTSRSSIYNIRLDPFENVYVVGLAINTLQASTGAFIPSSPPMDSQIRPKLIIRYPPPTGTGLQLQYRLRSLPVEPQLSTVTSGAAVIENWNPPGANATADETVVPSMTPHQLSKLQNTLFEMITGAPAGFSDNGMTVVNSSTVHGLHTHSARTPHTNEVAPVIMLWAESLGTCQSSGDALSTSAIGMSPYTTVINSTIACYTMTIFPDVPTTNFHVEILVFASVAPASAAVNIANLGGGAGTTTALTISRIGSTNWYRCYVSNPGGVTKGGVNRFTMSVTRTAAAGYVGIATTSGWIE